MTRILAADRAELAENVGGLDAALRFLAAALLLTATFGALHLFDIDWALSFILFGFLGVIYLLVTAVSRMDFLYHAFGRTTLRPERADADDVRLRRSRGLRRTSP